MSPSAISFVLFATALLPACNEQPPKKVPVDAGACAMPGTGAFLSMCTTDTDCSSCMCKTFGHSNLCTKTCSGPSDCEAPSSGCASNGICQP